MALSVMGAVLVKNSARTPAQGYNEEFRENLDEATTGWMR
jgi:hypothetical protein